MYGVVSVLKCALMNYPCKSDDIYETVTGNINVKVILALYCNSMSTLILNLQTSGCWTLEVDM